MRRATSSTSFSARLRSRSTTLAARSTEIIQARSSRSLSTNSFAVCASIAIPIAAERNYFNPQTEKLSCMELLQNLFWCALSIAPLSPAPQSSVFPVNHYFGEPPHTTCPPAVPTPSVAGGGCGCAAAVPPCCLVSSRRPPPVATTSASRFRAARFIPVVVGPTAAVRRWHWHHRSRTIASPTAAAAASSATTTVETTMRAVLLA